MNEEINFFNYWGDLWRDASEKTRRRLRNALIVYVVFLILGTYLAATQIAAVAQMSGLGKTMGAVAVGPFGVVWQVLTWLGLIVEDARDPGLAWLLPAFFHVAPWAGIIAIGLQPVNPKMLQERTVKKHEASQGHLSPEAVIAAIPSKTGIPFTTLLNREKKPVSVGLDYATGQGHVLVVAATRSGKGLHLTEVLKRWPGAAVVVDPKGEQYHRTAELRRRHVGPVYHLPGHQVRLVHYYDFRNPDDIKELHAQMLRPDEDSQRIFADKSLSLFRAVGHFTAARGQDALRVLLDAAEDDFQQVLLGLDSVPAARPFVRQFTNGQPPDKVTNNDRFVSSAYGTFTTRLFGYQKHIDTICPHKPKHTLPREWVEQKSTLYLTYSLNDLEGVGGVVSAILAGLMRDHMKHGKKQRLLVVIDETAAVRLRHLDTYLATVGGYGITMLLYAQSLSQLEGIYGHAGANAILSNCAHQLWYPPNDHQTAAHISAIFGTRLEPNRSFSTVSRTISQKDGRLQTVPQHSVNESLHEMPTFSPTEVMAMSKDKVFVFTEHGQQIRFVGQRLDTRATFSQLPPPPIPPNVPKSPRLYTQWILSKEESAGRESGENGTAGAETVPAEIATGGEQKKSTSAPEASELAKNRIGTDATEEAAADSSGDGSLPKESCAAKQVAHAHPPEDDGKVEINGADGDDLKAGDGAPPASSKKQGTWRDKLDETSLL
ncbi:MAG: hypothetical protein CL608_30080 [Anaerolineaceae bacterium]|nr:hypothetical protein [Anaerolineaceae bacterium]